MEMKNVQVRMHHGREIKVLQYNGNNVGEVIEFLQHKGSMAIVKTLEDKTLEITVGWNKFNLPVNCYIAYNYDGNFFSLFMNEVSKSTMPKIKEDKKESKPLTLVITTRSERVEVYNVTELMASDFFEQLNEENDFIGIAHYYFQRLLIESVELIVG
jgi:hypothetical protein